MSKITKCDSCQEEIDLKGQYVIVQIVKYDHVMIDYFSREYCMECYEGIKKEVPLERK